MQSAHSWRSLLEVHIKGGHAACLTATHSRLLPPVEVTPAQDRTTIVSVQNSLMIKCAGSKVRANGQGRMQTEPPQLELSASRAFPSNTPCLSKQWWQAN